MAAQLLGTGGVAALLLSGIARGRAASLDLALTLAVLAAFASIAFVKGAALSGREPAERPDDP
jgi:multicomponent Na+:H+ antiporter subunit F